MNGLFGKSRTGTACCKWLHQLVQTASSVMSLKTLSAAAGLRRRLPSAAQAAVLLDDYLTFATSHSLHEQACVTLAQELQQQSQHDTTATAAAAAPQRDTQRLAAISTHNAAYTAASLLFALTAVPLTMLEQELIPAVARFLQAADADQIQRCVSSCLHACLAMHAFCSACCVTWGLHAHGCSR